MVSEAPRSVLVVVTRRIGDVFLTGALIRSLRVAWPATRIDVLAFRGTEGILEINPDVSAIIAISEKMSVRENVALVARLWRTYDLALSTSPSDRPTLYAWAAGTRSVGVIADGAKSVWKKRLLSATVPFDDLTTHTVAQYLSLADALGIAGAYQPAVAWSVADDAHIARLFPEYASNRYAVLHPYPKFRYKMWSDEAWGELADWLARNGLIVVYSGGTDVAEMAYVSALVAQRRAINLAGKLSFGQLAALLKRALVYVGPDTVTTHLAAAIGTPTVALFGPSNPVKWGPWPSDWQDSKSPYQSRGTQIRGNVALVQGEGHCVPCLLEGCARAEDSESACLQMLRVNSVTTAIETLWRHRA